MQIDVKTAYKHQRIALGGKENSALANNQIHHSGSSKGKEGAVIGQSKQRKEIRYDKLNRLEAMKENQLDSINLKIKKMIDKISIEESPIVLRQRKRHQRIHTECLEVSLEKPSLLGLSREKYENAKDIFDNKKGTPTFTLEAQYFKSKNKEEKLEKIKLKYQKKRDPAKNTDFSAPKSLHKRKNSKDSMTTTHQSSVHEHIDNLSSAFGKKIDISQELSTYQKRVDSYNKKKQSLFRDCQIV